SDGRGGGVSPLEQHLVYETVARGSLSVALILSQRDAAIGLIDASDSAARERALDACAKGAMTTVGIAQLTTSRQGVAPALKATRSRDGYRIDGLIPWCTGAAKADFLVAGAATEDGGQLLFLLHGNAPGLTIHEPMPLVSLRSSWTTSVHCDRIEIPDEFVLRGPSDKVLIRDNHVPLGQAFLALGLCGGGLELIREHRSEAARKTEARFESQLDALRHRILELSDPAKEQEASAAAPQIRGECNDLALRITHAAVALYKGTALLAGHPAQRLAREAMFLLVWSCPNPVIDCTVDILSAEC
ncbi:MAG TPA: acyl-CoA dehydrogenase family protein, partial [Tepidisphaeraceae bacterium]|nr:acyl-CoA dehydrogenase family protein [Tepidisphaeraceae bacterium]